MKVVNNEREFLQVLAAGTAAGHTHAKMFDTGNRCPKIVEIRSAKWSGNTWFVKTGFPSYANHSRDFELRIVDVGLGSADQSFNLVLARFMA